MNRQALNLKEEAAKLESQLESSCNDLKMSEECHLLGRFLEIVKKDNAKAAAVYKSNCQDDQNENSCCDLGNAKCCFGAALANFSDDLDKGCVGKNPSLAINNLKRSCQLGSGMACQLLAHFSDIGIPGVVEKDFSASLKYDFEANRQLEVLEDRTKLVAILNSMKAMRTPSSGSWSIIMIDPNKEMEKLMPQLGMEFWSKCYRDNSPIDCRHLASFMYLIKDSEKSATLLRTTCDEHKYADSCHKYADVSPNNQIEF
uniref:Uncharacterized protein n=1 Tax=Daphnia galeata TaxID=27404 RepID=A0A8J2RBH9_9CRUS|nr:unnamed protein product [Daphnia galeata]